MTKEALISTVKQALQGAPDPILLAVSGGVDSMVLLQILYTIKHPFIVAHVNYGLRGKESDLDEELIRETCTRLHLTFESIKPDTPAFCSKHKLGIQEGARIIRYKWFEELKTKHRINYVLTAHHLNDNVETFFLHALRGSGLKGLKSMTTLNEDLGIIRPLIKQTKEELISYAQLNSIVYREDSSNSKNEYLRNAIRNEIIQALVKIDEDAVSKIGATLSHIQEEFDYLMSSLKKDSTNLLTSSGSITKITSVHSVHLRLLRFCLEKFDFSPHIVSELSRIQQSGKIITGPSHTLLFDRDSIYIRPNDFIVSTIHQIIPDSGSYVLANGYQVRVSLENNQIYDYTDPNTVYIDADKTTFPLTIRNWNRGDYMHPLGMSGKKKISDLLTDKKLTVWEKEAVLIVESNVSICWVMGLVVSEKHKITPFTKKIIKIETSS
jgi:tRNA(Ile)-lysidine synthase